MIILLYICTKIPFYIEKIGFNLHSATDLLCDLGQVTSLLGALISGFVSDGFDVCGL